MLSAQSWVAIVVHGYESGVLLTQNSTLRILHGSNTFCVTVLSTSRSHTALKNR